MAAPGRDEAGDYELHQLPQGANIGEQAGTGDDGDAQNPKNPIGIVGGIARNGFRYQHLDRALERPHLTGI